MIHVVGVQVQVLGAGVKPLQALPGGLAAGVTGAVGIAVLAVGLLLDIFVLHGRDRANRWRMAAAVLVYFSGWLTMLEAFGARRWWATMFPDPGMLLLVRLAGLGLLGFLTAAVFGLALTKITPVGEVAHKKIMGKKEGEKVKATGSAIGWAAVVALFALSMPANSWVATNFTGVLAAPGTIVANTVISAAVRGVGGGA